MGSTALSAVSRRGLRIRFSFMQISYWCSTAAFNSFAVAFFNANGWSASAIGVMLAVFTLASFFASFLFGQLCDRLHTHRKVFIGCNMAMLAVTVLVYFTVRTPFLGICYALLGMFISPLASNMDTWVLKSFYDTPQEYGLIRGFGSLGYATFTLFYGSLISRLGFGVMLPFTALFTVLNIVAALIVPDITGAPGPAARPPVQAPKKGAGELGRLLRSGKFAILLAVLFLFGLVHCPVYQYIAMIFDAVGANVTYQSLALSISAFAQVPMMMFSRSMGRFSPYGLMLGAAGLYLTSNAIIGFTGSPPVVLGGFLVAGLAYGLLLPTLRKAIFDSSSPQLRTTAQGLGDAFFGSLAGMTSSLAGGFILDATSVTTLMAVCCVITLPLVPLLWLLLRMSRRGADQGPRP